MALKVYLAGPEVFLPKGRELIARKHAMLAEFGLLPSARQGEFLTWTDRSASEIGLEISRHNEKLIEEADLLIANITPFRSLSADPGTVSELGYMGALGRPVYAYSNDARDYAARAALHPALAPVGYAADERHFTWPERWCIAAAAAGSGIGKLQSFHVRCWRGRT